METRGINVIFVLLASMCYLCEARWINTTDKVSMPDTSRNAKLNESKNASNVLGRLRSFTAFNFLQIRFHIIPYY